MRSCYLRFKSKERQIQKGRIVHRSGLENISIKKNKKQGGHTKKLLKKITF